MMLYAYLALLLGLWPVEVAGGAAVYYEEPEVAVPLYEEAVEVMPVYYEEPVMSMPVYYEEPQISMPLYHEYPAYAVPEEPLLPAGERSMPALTPAVDPFYVIGDGDATTCTEPLSAYSATLPRLAVPNHVFLTTTSVNVKVEIKEVAACDDARVFQSTSIGYVGETTERTWSYFDLCKQTTSTVSGDLIMCEYTCFSKLGHGSVVLLKTTKGAVVCEISVY